MASKVIAITAQECYCQYRQYRRRRRQHQCRQESESARRYLRGCPCVRGQPGRARANHEPRNSRERRSVPGPSVSNQTLTPSPWKARSRPGGLETLYTLRATFCRG